MVLSHCENAKKLGFVAPLLFSYAPGKANRGDSCTLGTRGGAAIAMAALGQAVRGRERCNKLVFSAFERFVRFSYHPQLESASNVEYFVSSMMTHCQNSSKFIDLKVYHSI